MVMNLQESLLFGVGLLAIIEPFSSLAFFNAYTKNYKNKIKNASAIISALGVAIILIAGAWGGEYIIKLFGISVDALRVAGGLVILPNALTLVKGESTDTAGANPKNRKKNWFSGAIVPLAIPATIDGATIALVITQVTKYNSIEGLTSISFVIMAVAVIIGIIYLLCNLIRDIIGETGISIATRLSGIILVAIAVTAIVSGLKEMLPGLAG